MEKKLIRVFVFMQVCSFETEIKAIVIGNGKIGKTSLMTRFADGSFSEEYRKTIGVDFLEKRVFVAAIHEEVTFYLYDTAGQEEYDSMTRSFYQGAGVAIIGFSSVDRESFRAVPKWIRTVREECGQIPILLVQTKTDLLHSTDAISTQEADSISVETGLRLFRVCAKDNVNVDQVFEQLCFDYVKRRRLLGGQLERPVRTLHSLVNEKENKVRIEKNDDCKGDDSAKKNINIFSNCVVS